MKTLLITGVSSGLGHRLAETPIEDLGKVMAVNLWANQRLLAQFSSSRGTAQVVGISSGAAIKWPPRLGRLFALEPGDYLVLAQGAGARGSTKSAPRFTATQSP